MARIGMDEVEGKWVAYWQLPDWDATLNRSEGDVEQV